MGGSAGKWPGEVRAGVQALAVRLPANEPPKSRSSEAKKMNQPLTPRLSKATWCRRARLLEAGAVAVGYGSSTTSIAAGAARHKEGMHGLQEERHQFKPRERLLGAGPDHTEHWFICESLLTHVLCWFLFPRGLLTFAKVMEQE